MTTTRHTSDVAVPTMSQRAMHGAAGGLVGGLIFGVLMQAMGMLPMVAQLVGSTSVLVGWVVHLAISAFIGVTFGLLLGPWATTLARGAALGAAYGLLWWVLGGLIAMPARMGMPVLELSTMAWQSLMGHLLYGLALGLTYVMLARRHSA